MWRDLRNRILFEGPSGVHQRGFSTRVPNRAAQLIVQLTFYQDSMWLPVFKANGKHNILQQPFKQCVIAAKVMGLSEGRSTWCVSQTASCR